MLLIQCLSSCYDEGGSVYSEILIIIVGPESVGKYDNEGYIYQSLIAIPTWTEKDMARLRESEVLFLGLALRRSVYGVVRGSSTTPKSMIGWKINLESWDEMLWTTYLDGDCIA